MQLVLTWSKGHTQSERPDWRISVHRHQCLVHASQGSIQPVSRRHLLAASTVLLSPLLVTVRQGSNFGERQHVTLRRGYEVSLAACCMFRSMLLDMQSMPPSPRLSEQQGRGPSYR